MAEIVNFMCSMQVAGTIESCCRGVSPVDLAITIGTIPIHDNFELNNPGMVISNQPMPSQKLIGEVPPMIPPQTQTQTPIPMPMPPLPNQNGSALPYPFAPFPNLPNTSTDKNIPGAPPSAPPNAFAPSAPDFGESKFHIFLIFN